MAASGKNAELIQAAEAFALAVKNFDGDPSEQMKLLKQADKLRFLVETPLDTVMKQWEMVSDCSLSIKPEIDPFMLMIGCRAISWQRCICSSRWGRLKRCQRKGLSRPRTLPASLASMTLP
jgi:hypothetical protein